MSRTTNLQAGGYNKADPKPEPLTVPLRVITKSMPYVEVPELTLDKDGPVTRIYGATKAEAKRKAAEAIKAAENRGTTQILRSMTVSRKRMQVQQTAAAKSKLVEPKLKAQYGSWKVTGKPIRLRDGAKLTVMVECSCGASDTRQVDALVKGKSTRCDKCRRRINKRRENERAKKAGPSKTQQAWASGSVG